MTMEKGDLSDLWFESNTQTNQLLMLGFTILEVIILDKESPVFGAHGSWMEHKESDLHGYLGGVHSTQVDDGKDDDATTTRKANAMGIVLK